MANSMDKVAKELKKAMEASDERKPKPYDTQAEVLRVEGSTAWVHFPGGIEETPVRLTINAKEGDMVNIHVANGSAWITGNGTNPPTDDTRAEQVYEAAGQSIDFVSQLVDKDVTVKSITAATGYIDDLYSKNIYTENISAATGYINDLTADNITAGDIVADHATIDSLDTHYAQIDIANVNNAWIENGTIKKAEVFDENVFDLSGNRATLSRIDASKINVANLRADNLIVRRINGQPVVGGYTLVDSNSPGYSSKNPQALGWYEFVNAQWVLSTDTSVDMTKAYYQEGNEVSLYDQTYIDGLENSLQQQIDGAVETYTGTVVPTLVNKPYTDWYDTSVTPIHDERAKHVGDIYYVVNSAASENGYCYRFAYDNTSHAYSWVLIKDSDVTKALSDISELKTFESNTTSWMDETDEGLETIRTNYTNLSGRVDDVEDTANAALPAADFQVFESTTFTDLVDEVDEQSTTMTNMTTRLGLNSDGTQTATDIVAKESALEQTVEGISTRVSKTETHLIGMYATCSTAEATKAKVATIVPEIPSSATWELTQGTTVTVKFTTANTHATPTLNVNGTGAKNIKSYNNTALDPDEYEWPAGSTFTFTYNGTNWLMQDSTVAVRMSSAETSISQNAEAITLEAESREAAVNILLDSDAPNLGAVYASANRYISDASSTSGYVTCTNVALTDPPEQGIKYARRFVCNGTNTSSGANRAYTFYNSTDNIIPYTPNTTYTATWWARCTGGTGCTTRIQYPAGGTTNVNSPNIELTSEWKKCTATFTTKSELNTNYNRIWFYARFPASSTATIDICGCKLVAGDAVEAYSTKIEQTANNVLIQATASDTTAAQGGQHLIQSLINVAPSGVTIDASKVNITGVITAINNDTTTTIDGGKITAHSIGASLIAVSDNTNLATANELYESSLPTNVSEVYKITIRNGYLTKKTATQQYLMLTDYVPNSFNNGDELYYEFVGKAAVAGTVQICAWGYEGTPASPTAIISNGATIDLTTADKTFSGTITLGNAAWGNKTCYLLGFNDNRDTKSQIYIKNCAIRRKSAGELIVDGSITSDHISSNKIDANKINVGQIQIGDLSGSIGGVNLLTNDKVRKTGSSNGITFSTSSAGPEYIKISGTATADVDQWVANLQDITATGMSVTISTNALWANSTGIYFFVSTTKDGALYKNYRQITWYSNTERRLTINLESGETLRYLRIFVPSGQTVSGNYRFKVETGNKQTAWTPSKDAYITDIGNNGIRIHSSLTLDDSVVIDSTGMEIFKGNVSVAKYGDTARIGKENTRHVEIKDGGMQVLSDSSTELANLGFGSGKSISGTTVAPYYTLGKRKSGSTIGNYSVAEGYNTTASHVEAHAEGYNTTASGTYAHAEGRDSVASGDVSHAEGSGTTASNDRAHAEGNGTTASGYASHAEGYYTVASGSESHASGYYTIAKGSSQVALGNYNVGDTTSVIIIGNGTADDARSNALTVSKAGTVNIASSQSYKVNGTIVASARAKTTITPTASGVSNYSNYGNSYYEKAGNVVHVHIGVKGVTANTVVAIATLPSGYRPTSIVFGHGTGGSSDNIGYMDISTAGVIQVRSSTGYIGADVTYFV